MLKKKNNYTKKMLKKKKRLTNTPERKGRHLNDWMNE